MLLDQEGVEVDPVERLEGDTPLHRAVRWCNGLEGKGGGREVVELLLDAGADPRCVFFWVLVLAKGIGWRDGVCVFWGERGIGADDFVWRRIRNKAKLKALELVDPRNAELRSVLQKAEFAIMAGDDVVNGEEEDGGRTGSASESE